jgi:hypothetical protein
VKRTPTTRDISLLKQLYDQGQLLLAPEFQRNSVWPPAAKAYLIDTILNNLPIPLFFFQRATSAQSGKTIYSVIDGQQRLRAIFDFLEGRFRLTQSKEMTRKNKRFHQLLGSDQEQVLNYDLVVEELSGYTDATIRDVFIRINRFVVKLSPQELRHAKEDPNGKFARFVEKVGQWDFWKRAGVFTGGQIRRMVPTEFAAELTILLIEGPQDKKASVDLYYGQYRDSFPGSAEVEKRLAFYVQWLQRTVPDLATTRFRRPVDMYALIGAIDRIASDMSLSRTKGVGSALKTFDKRTRAERPDAAAARYLAAASRQTDNIAPRITRIDTLEKLIRNAR